MDKRKLIWQHNALLGRTKYTQSAMRAITSAKTTTEESKALADQIYELSLRLYRSLGKRKET